MDFVTASILPGLKAAEAYQRAQFGMGVDKDEEEGGPTLWFFTLLHGFQLGKQADEPLKGFLVSIDPNKVHLEKRKYR